MNTKHRTKRQGRTGKMKEWRMEPCPRDGQGHKIKGSNRRMMVAARSNPLLRGIAE